MLDGNKKRLSFDKEQLAQQGNPIFFTGSVDAYKVKRELKDNVDYIITFRDPIDRLMSAYNYYNFQLQKVYHINQKMDFKIWFMNKRTLKPVAWEYQYIDVIRKKFAVMSDEDWNTLQNDSAVALDHHRWVEQALEELEHWKPYILTVEQDHVNKVQIILDNKCPGMFKFNEDMRYENRSKDIIESRNQINFDDLDNSTKNRVLDELADERGFYQKCINLH